MGHWDIRAVSNNIGLQRTSSPVSSPPPAFEGHVISPTAPREATWLDSGQARMGAPAFWCPVSVQATPALVMAESSTEQVTTLGQGDGLEAQHLGHSRGEEGEMKGHRSERGRPGLFDARLGSAAPWLCDPRQST